MEWFIALRYLRGKRKIGFISLITYITAAGVLLGTAVLIIALSIANGFEKEVRDRIIGTQAHARVLKYHGRDMPEYKEVREQVLELPEIIAASPYIEGKAGIEHDEVAEGVMAFGIDTDLEAEVTDLPQTIKYGTFNLDSAVSKRERKLPGVLLGLGLADKLGVRQGSEVVLISLTPQEGQVDPVPRTGRYVIKGIFETGMYEYDLNLVFVSLESAADLFGVSGAHGLRLRTHDLFKADQTALKAREKLGGYPYRSSDWKAENKSLFQWMKLEKLVIFIVISLIILVAAFNIISSLIMMILEKRREIGILMGMGATRRSIMKIFLLNGAIIGFLGSTLGAIGGVAICLAQYHWKLIPLPGDIYFINELPVLVRPMDALAVYIAANIICLIAASYPAWRASRVLPAESIRYE